MSNLIIVSICLNDVNYYKVLDVSENATLREIKNAYRRLARKYHPDRNPKVSDDVMKNINIAFEILSDSKKRQEYDKILSTIVLKNLDNTSQIHHHDPRYVQTEWDVNTISIDNNDQTLNSNGDSDNHTESRFYFDQDKMSLVNNDNYSLESRYRIIVEPSLCLAFGSCETLAPKVFVVEKNRHINPKAVVISETGEDFEIILDAAKTCPTKAIIIIDRYTGKCVYP